MMAVFRNRAPATQPMTDKNLLSTTPRSTLQRRPTRGSYDRALVNSIVDESLVCHVSFVEDGYPVVVPATPWRIDDWLYLHGSRDSRLIQQVSSGAAICVSFALIDGLVFARSAMRHSTNYRSVVLFAQGEPVDDPETKAAVLMQLIDKLSPGRSGMVRPPNEGELAVTGVVRLPITEGSAKVRAEGPAQTSLDDGWNVWAGTIPMKQRQGRPVVQDGLGSCSLPELPAWLERCS
jgi:hypothetical protein